LPGKIDATADRGKSRVGTWRVQQCGGESEPSDEHVTGDGRGIAAELPGKILVADAARAIRCQDQGDIHCFRRSVPQLMPCQKAIAKQLAASSVTCVS
jgi:hypothetical protein